MAMTMEIIQRNHWGAHGGTTKTIKCIHGNILSMYHKMLRDTYHLHYRQEWLWMFKATIRKRLDNKHSWSGVVKGCTCSQQTWHVEMNVCIHWSLNTSCGRSHEVPGDRLHSLLVSQRTVMNENIAKYLFSTWTFSPHVVCILSLHVSLASHIRCKDQVVFMLKSGFVGHYHGH